MLGTPSFSSALYHFEVHTKKAIFSLYCFLLASPALSDTKCFLAKESEKVLIQEGSQTIYGRNADAFHRNQQPSQHINYQSSNSLPTSFRRDINMIIVI